MVAWFQVNWTKIKEVWDNRLSVIKPIINLLDQKFSSFFFLDNFEIHIGLGRKRRDKTTESDLEVTFRLISLWTCIKSHPTVLSHYELVLHITSLFTIPTKICIKPTGINCYFVSQHFSKSNAAYIRESTLFSPILPQIIPVLFARSNTLHPHLNI